MASMLNRNSGSYTHDCIGKQRRFSFSSKEVCDLLAKILIPLMIGIFTIVITVQQHNSGKENRRKDLEIASELRQQQSHLDEQRRAQEFALDEARRAQDLSIADSNHRDSVFNVYIRDLSNLLLVNHYNLSRPLLDSIIRPMTLTVLRQLDSSRKTLLLKFLYESKMIRDDFESTRVHLVDADLSGIQFGAIRMPHLSLPGALLTNVSFVRTDLTTGNFERADLTDATFENGVLAETCLYRARLVHVRFFQSKLVHADLALADLTQSTITDRQLQTASSYNQAILPNGEKATRRSLIASEDQCSLNNWIIEPERAVNLTSRCRFLALLEAVKMQYNLHISTYRRLIEKGQALLEFHFQALSSAFSKPIVTFIYYADETVNHEIDRQPGLTLASMGGTTGDSFTKHWITASYPRNARFLTVEVAINAGDQLSNFEFYVDHADYLYD